VEASQLLLDARRVSLNIFPSTLLETPPELIYELLHSVRAPSLVLEVNEQEFIGDPQKLVGRLQILKSAGVRIALDDIGFGRSAIETLLAIEPDIVKIDRCAVKGVAESEPQRKVLARLLGCLASLGTEVIAEGIETEADAKVIADLGVSLAQGFLWGVPESILME
jgi:EAL domain-containing protein (putative c-di-GMP-specific phosphodiesterase class I)